jgi:hypothetical protein
VKDLFYGAILLRVEKVQKCSVAVVAAADRIAGEKGFQGAETATAPIFHPLND